MPDNCPPASTPFTCIGCGAEADDLEALAEACVDYVSGIGRCPARTEVVRQRRRREHFRQLLASDPVGAPVIAGNGSPM